MEVTPTVVRVIIISGRSGVGKSTVTYEVCHQLRQRKYAHVHIEADNLDAAYPRPNNNKLMLANLKVVWRNFAALGGDHALILSGTAIVMHQAEIKSVIGEVSDGSVEMQPIILTAGNETVEARLMEREIGTDLEDHLKSSERMAKLLEDFDEGSASRIQTDSRGVENIAGQIVEIIITNKDV